MTTSAPTSRYLITSSALSTPLLAASEDLMRPASTPIQSSCKRISRALLSSRLETSASRARSISGS